MKIPLLTGLLLIGCLLAGPAEAGDFPVAPPQKKLIEIGTGITSIDLTGDGEAEKIIKVYRQRFDAYGHYNIIFLWHGGYGPDETTEGGSGNDIISIESEHGEQDNLIVPEPIECTQVDYRLFFKNNKTYLIKAEMDSYPKTGDCEEDSVRFQSYILKNNKSGVPGFSEFYFQNFKQWTTQKKYKNVQDSFENNEAAINNVTE